MPAKFVKSIGRTLDARPDRLDLRDREFTPAVASLPEEFPGDGTIRQLLPRYYKAGLILDQGEEGACTGFGLACVVNYLLWRDRLRQRSRTRQKTVSARMLYHLARFYDEWPGEDYQGSSCRGALKAWHKHGVCTEALWPYRDAEGTVKFIRPLDGWAEDALQRRIGVYYRVNRASVVDMQSAIIEIGAIYVSCDVHDGWEIEVRNNRSRVMSRYQSSSPSRTRTRSVGTPLHSSGSIAQDLSCRTPGVSNGATAGSACCRTRSG